MLNLVVFIAVLLSAILKMICKKSALSGTPTNSSISLGKYLILVSLKSINKFKLRM